MLPTKRLILMILAAAPLFMAGMAVPVCLLLAIVYLLLLLACMLVDLLLLPRRRSVSIERIVPGRLSLNVPVVIQLRIQNRSRRTLHMVLSESLPADIKCDPQIGSVQLAPQSEALLEYDLTAAKRGRFLLHQLYVRMASSMSLFYRQFVVKDESELHVYPNLQNLHRYELMVRKGLWREQGLARLRYQGRGSEFESLRLYASGDPMSRVDWKATAKRKDLVVRNYEPERRQSIIVALDTGRATSGELEGLSRLDYFVNATLLLADVVLRQGDWFSVVAFSDTVETYLPPIRHISQIDRVAQMLYRLQPRVIESDYAHACHYLGLRNRKRSLVCLMTDIIDRQANADILGYMGRFVRQHLPMVVTLRDPDIQKLSEESLTQSNDIYSKAAAIDVMEAREEALRTMRSCGVIILDTLPQQLNPNLVNRYIQIKSTHRL